MSQKLEFFKTQRTKIISEMLDNPDHLGIYPTTKAFNSLDGLAASIMRQEAIEFAAEYAYRKANPNTKMDVPSIVYEDAETFYDKNYGKNN